MRQMFKRCSRTFQTLTVFAWGIALCASSSFAQDETLAQFEVYKEAEGPLGGIEKHFIKNSEAINAINRLACKVKIQQYVEDKTHGGEKDGFVTLQSFPLDGRSWNREANAFVLVRKRSETSGNGAMQTTTDHVDMIRIGVISVLEDEKKTFQFILDSRFDLKLPIPSLWDTLLSKKAAAPSLWKVFFERTASNIQRTEMKAGTSNALSHGRLYVKIECEDRPNFNKKSPFEFENGGVLDFEKFSAPHSTLD